MPKVNHVLHKMIDVIYFTPFTEHVKMSLFIKSSI